MNKIATLSILVTYFFGSIDGYSQFSSKKGATFNKLDGSSYPPLTDLYPIEADNGFNNDDKKKYATTSKDGYGSSFGTKKGATFNIFDGSSFPPLTDLYPIEADNGFNNDKGKFSKGKKTVDQYDSVPADASVVGTTTPKEFYNTNDDYRIVNDDRIVNDKGKLQYSKGGIDKTDIFGKAGPKGQKGDRGEPGKDGLDGKPGAKGNPGKPGKSHEGKKGDKGKTGPIGEPGKDGYPGKNGENGHNGKKGLTGPIGAPGKDGKQGAPGIKGDIGYPGRDGKQGPTGPPGKAKTGKRGPPGPPGPPGNCQCGGKKRSQPKRNVSPVTIDTGLYGNDLFYGGYDDFNKGSVYGNGYGSPKGLSGNAEQYGYYDYAPKIDETTLPKRYDDGYDFSKNSKYDVVLPNSKNVAGVGSIGGYNPYGGNKNIKSSSGYNGKNIGGIKNNAILGKRGAVLNKKRDDEEEKKFAKAKESEIYGDAKIKTETKLKTDGYNDELAYAGAEIFEDAAAAEEKYIKGEQFIQEGQEAFKKDSEYGGDAIYQNDDVTTDANVAFMVDHSLNFRNDFVDENHRGKYKGDEFDVNYKATDVQGGYKNNELDRSKKAAAYKGAKANGEKQQLGKFFEDEFDKYGDKDVDLYYKAKGKGTPEGFDPKFGGPTDEYIDNGGYPDDFKGKPDLYSRFRGDKKGDFIEPGSRSKKYGDYYGNGNGLYGDAYGPGGYEPNPPYGERYRVKESAEKDDKYKGFGTNFDAKDAFSDRLDTEIYAGAEEQIKEKAAFDKGNYRDVNAKGANKFASYAGDYQTNNKAQDVDFKVMHNEDLTQQLNQNVNSDLYFAKYNGQDKKFARDAELKNGIYTDAEKKRKQDAFINAKNYKGNDFSNDIKVENEADIYYGLKKEAEQKNELKARPGGYRGESKYNPRYNEYDDYGYTGDDDDKDKYMKDRVTRGDYRYLQDYKRRRFMEESHNELNKLKIQLSSLKLLHIMSMKDTILCIIAIICASIFGSLSFVALMKFAGYKAKKIVNEQNVNLMMQ